MYLSSSIVFLECYACFHHNVVAIRTYTYRDASSAIAGQYNMDATLHRGIIFVSFGLLTSSNTRPLHRRLRAFLLSSQVQFSADGACSAGLRVCA